MLDVTDKNECDDSPGVCGNGTCRNVVGGFECFCSPGFEPGSDGTCKGIFFLFDICHRTMIIFELNCACSYDCSFQ